MSVQDWVSVFPSSSNDSSVDERGDVVILGDNDSVWSRLIPMESSPALSYQWAESQANRHLLTALNIDSRNIVSYTTLVSMNILTVGSKNETSKLL